MFSIKVKKKIKKLESKEKIFKKFLSLKEVNDLIKIEKNSSKFFVNKPEGRKRGLGKKGNETTRNPEDWHPKIKQIILPKLKKIFPNYEITRNEFPPHFFNNEYPTVLHADTGRNKKAVIYKQILIPLKIIPSKKIKTDVYTIIFNRRWYGPACTFRFRETKLKNYSFDYTIKDQKSNFIRVNDLRIFYDAIKNSNKKFFKYENGIFKNTNDFKKHILNILSNTKKRYNRFSSEHISNNKKFNYKQYKKYLTHQPIEDFQSLKIETLFKWSIGDMLVWDRTKLHSSNNYSKDGIKRKMGLSIFLSYKNKL